MTASIVERLRARVPAKPTYLRSASGHEGWTDAKTISSEGAKLINPDGPEAATLIEKLVEVLELSRDRFREYECQHRAKAELVADDEQQFEEWRARDRKAKRNREMADLCNEALSLTKGQGRGE